MILGEWALVLNLFTITALVFAITILCTSISIWYYKPFFLQINATSRKILLWLYVLAPSLTSLCTTVIFIFTEFFTNSVTANALTHWHHKEFFDPFNWHSINLGIFLSITCLLIVKKIAVLYHYLNEIKFLCAFSFKKNPHFYTIESKQPSAFTCGVIKQYCFLSTSLLEKITEEEKNIILHHELAHAKHRDPFKKWLFSFFAAFFIAPIKKYLILNMTLAMEQKADQAVILANYEPTFIAATLVKVASLSPTSPYNYNQISNHFGMEVLEQRVHYLLGLQEIKPFKISLPISIFIAFTSLIILSIDSLHHFIESILN